MSRKQKNYLTTHRKKCGFTQGEIAFLLSGYTGSKISRYERSIREPDLRDAFGCEVTFDTPAKEIFPGIFNEVKQSTKEKAKLLLRKLEDTAPTPRTERKKEVLKQIASRPEHNHRKKHD